MESVEQVANMLAMDPYPGHQGKWFSMPCRNVVPKPVQQPHPPIWVACSNRETIHLAARLGIGALTFAFVDPSEAKHWVDDYYRTLERECVPIGHAVNANIAMVTGFSCHPDAEEAKQRGLDGFRFFGFALGHFYGFGTHKPGRTDIWKTFEQVRGALPDDAERRGIGTPEQLRAHLRGFADVGVDQVVFIQQGGNNRHQHICESLELFAREVMPEFKDGEEERERRKAERLAPVIEAAMARKQRLRPLADDEIPEYPAYGRMVLETDTPIADPAQRERLERMKAMRQALERRG
jgi:alkanesulfonate monooxygenase SsuD/methylene tetrahydromethanopterin reductase-like flavin-dependent oxidoreductase (luciferase family)